mmetsp:Transcript_68905/g.155887  ORF Transcript_68905/g.155887 Transcript_68905/m.155887 type:complete len:201 (-) Transcript_68905:2351-2953(-)
MLPGARRRKGANGSKETPINHRSYTLLPPPWPARVSMSAAVAGRSKTACAGSRTTAGVACTRVKPPDAASAPDAAVPATRTNPDPAAGAAAGGGPWLLRGGDSAAAQDERRCEADAAKPRTRVSGDTASRPSPPPPPGLGEAGVAALPLGGEWLAAARRWWRRWARLILWAPASWVSTLNSYCRAEERTPPLASLSSPNT